MSANGKKKICHIHVFTLSLPIIFKKDLAAILLLFLVKKLIVRKLNKNNIHRNCFLRLEPT
jgi:hypothetical protein